VDSLLGAFKFGNFISEAEASPPGDGWIDVLGSVGWGYWLEIYSGATTRRATANTGTTDLDEVIRYNTLRTEATLASETSREEVCKKAKRRTRRRILLD
jgi:hypothetical protein